jgi:hypothetical protein
VSQVILFIAPNDFDIRLPGFFTRTRLRRVIREITPVVEAILKDPALAVKISWNDLRRRSDWSSTGHS